MAFVEQNILKLCISGIIDKFYYLEAKALRVSYVYRTVHHLYSCVERKNQLDATYFII